MQTVSYFGYVLYLPTAQGRRNLIFLHAFHRHPPPRAAEALYCMCLPLAQRRRNLLLAAQGHRDLVILPAHGRRNLVFRAPPVAQGPKSPEARSFKCLPQPRAAVTWYFTRLPPPRAAETSYLTCLPPLRSRRNFVFCKILSLPRAAESWY